MQLLGIVFTILRLTIVWADTEPPAKEELKSNLNGTTTTTTVNSNETLTSVQTPVKVDGLIKSSNELVHLGREHVEVTHVEAMDIQNVSNVNISVNTAKVQISSNNEQKKNTHSVPRKGVNYTEATLLPNNNQSILEVITTTTQKPIVKKPTVTENSDGNFIPSTDIKTNLQLQSSLLIENKERKSAAYVIPIVGVILSVPLVAIIMSILYKRGSEWWQHRHYRRMDFLIEGMYNN